MKNWKIYIYLLLTYVLMHVSSLFVVQYMFDYFKEMPGMAIEQAKYDAQAWGLFIVNTIAAIIFLLILIPNRKFFNAFKGKKSSIGQAVLWGFIGFFLAMAGQMLGAFIENLLGIKLGSENTAVLSEIAKASPIIILPMVLYAPFLEEIIFRRVVFGGVYQKTNFYIAAIISALVFAAVHMEFTHLLMYMMPALVFAYIYHRTKRLLAPMITHLLMNSFVVFVQLNVDKLQDFVDKNKPLFSFFFN